MRVKSGIVTFASVGFYLIEKIVMMWSQLRDETGLLTQADENLSCPLSLMSHCVMRKPIRL